MPKRTNTWQKATALVPLALLSGAWTASLAVSSANAAGDKPGSLPDGTDVPTEAIKAPASVSNPGEIAPGIPSGTGDDVVSSAATNGIPAVALAAYQRAAQVIDSADPSCNVDWTLIAAIGRVESNHGRYGGNVLTQDGVSNPGIFGIPLDGTNGTAKITDTDAGQYDNDPVYDRAVGAMQFIPSTWSVVGVDGDGDGKRNPQDIDDSSLAAAVYLCSGKEDLSTRGGEESAVFRYNHSAEYVKLVLAIADAYANGDYSSVPTSSYAPTTFGPSYEDSVYSYHTSGYHYPRYGHHKSGGGSGGTTTSGGGTGSGGATGGLKDTVGGVIDGATGTVTNTLTDLQKATQWCQTNLTSSQLDLLGGLDTCTQTYLDGGATAVQDLLASLLDLGNLTGGLSDGLSDSLGGSKLLP